MNITVNQSALHTATGDGTLTILTESTSKANKEETNGDTAKITVYCFILILLQNIRK